MRLLDLIEMPVRSMSAQDTSGGEGGSFMDKRDWALVSRPAAVKRVTNALRNIPINVDLYFYNLPIESEHAGYMDHSYIDDIKGYRDNNPNTAESIAGLGRFLTDHFEITLPQPSASGVNILFFYHDGGLAERLTPWMVAHRIAHGVEYRLNGVIHQAAFDHIYANDEDADTDVPFMDLNDMMNALIAISTMRSARTGKLDSSEVSNELFSQFLVTGKVTFNTDDAVWPFDTDVIPNASAQWETEINAGFTKIVESWVGKYVVAD